MSESTTPATTCCIHRFVHAATIQRVRREPEIQCQVHVCSSWCEMRFLANRLTFHNLQYVRGTVSGLHSGFFTPLERMIHRDLETFESKKLINLHKLIEQNKKKMSCINCYTTSAKVIVPLYSSIPIIKKILKHDIHWIYISVHLQGVLNPQKPQKTSRVCSATLQTHQQ